MGEIYSCTAVKRLAGSISRDERIYSIFNTKKFFNKPPLVSINDKSGLDGVTLWVNKFLGLPGGDRQHMRKIAKITRWVTQQYDVHGQTTSISDEEMEALVRQHLH